MAILASPPPSAHTHLCSRHHVISLSLRPHLLSHRRRGTVFVGHPNTPVFTINQSLPLNPGTHEVIIIEVLPTGLLLEDLHDSTRNHLVGFKFFALGLVLFIFSLISNKKKPKKNKKKVKKNKNKATTHFITPMDSSVVRAANPAATPRIVPRHPAPTHEVMKSLQNTVAMAIVVIGNRAIDAECQLLGVDQSIRGSVGVPW